MGATLNFSSLQVEFDQAGFNLVGTLPLSILSQAEQDELRKHIANFTSGGFLLVATGGQDLWHKSATWRAANPQEPDKYNRYSLLTADEILKKHNIQYETLYPASSEIPKISLVNCGKELGWHEDSLLGLGMHSVYGLWSAYRLLLWIVLSY